MRAPLVQGPSKTADGERDRVLGALGPEPLSGWEVAGRLRERGETGVPDAEAFLYPALHGLEADGRIRADWLPGRAGSLRRRYRLRG